MALLGTGIEQCLPQLRIHLPFDPVTPLLEFYLKLKKIQSIETDPEMTKMVELPIQGHYIAIINAT